MAEGQGKELGAVLIAVNSYHNDPIYCLPYADRVLKGYIETFHQYLFFQVHVVVNYTLKTFKDALDDFIKICRKDELTRIAVVLYGHGGVLHGKECILTDIGEPLEIPTLQSVLHWQLDADKYIFIDACRTSNQHYVLQVATPLTTLVRSTLVFGVATTSAWSECFAMNLRKAGTLTQVVINVDSDLKNCGFNQKSEVHYQGPGDEPNFRRAAMDLDLDAVCIRELNSVLLQKISDAKLKSTTIRDFYGLGSEPNIPFIDRQPDDHFGDTPMEQSLNIQGDPPDNHSYLPALSLMEQSLSAQGPTAPRTGMDKKIRSSLDIVRVSEYRNDLSSKMDLLRASLGMDSEEQTAAISQRNYGTNGHLLEILDTYIKEKSPTWRDFSTALKKYSDFDAVWAKIEADHSLSAQSGLPPKPILAFLESPPDDRSNLTGPGLALSSEQGLATANLPPHLPPVAPLSKRQCNNPSKQPSAQGTQSSCTSSTQTMAGTTATTNQTPPNPPVAVITSPSDNPSKQSSAQGTLPSSTSSTHAMAGVTSTSTTGLDAVIASVDEILKYKKDMIAHQKILGTVLRLEGMTDTILQGPNALNYTATLIKILETWMEDNISQVTWRDLVTALEKISNFNRLVYNIKKDHAA